MVTPESPATGIAESVLAEIEARVNAATPGPWSVKQIADGVRHLHRNESWYFEGLPLGYNLPGRQGMDGGERDGEFIAHARTDLPAALDRIEELERELDEAIGPEMDNNDALQILCRAFDDWEPIWEQWLSWYNPKEWLHRSRGFGAFMRHVLNARTTSDEVRDLQASVAARYEYIAKQSDEIAKLRAELSTSQERVRELGKVMEAAVACAADAACLDFPMCEVSTENMHALNNTLAALSPDTQRETT